MDRIGKMGNMAAELKIVKPTVWNASYRNELKGNTIKLRNSLSDYKKLDNLRFPFSFVDPHSMHFDEMPNT